MKWITALFILTLGVLGVTGQKPATAAVRTVTSVDLNRYSGKWYEVARYPNRFQEQCVSDTTATYTLKEAGKLEVLNQCVKKDGELNAAKGAAKIVDDKTSNAKLKVRFAPSFLSVFGFVWGDYWVIDLGKNYEYSVVGDPDRKYLWILSREPSINDAAYREIIRRVEEQGFDPSKLIKTPQNGRS
jgi:apolipoprotein D and lipocalin family protein